MEKGGGDGTLQLSGDISLGVTNLDKVFFPATGRTKGDVMRYYVRVSPQLLPLIADRPLILRRHPDGVDGKSFFQHEPPEEVPAGVRVQDVETAEGTTTRRLIGGSLATLLYGVQLGAIAVNPWHSRLGSIDTPDYVIFDLDPGERATFATVVEVALRLHEILEEREVHAGVKTSGSRGLHVYVPLAQGTAYERALAWAQDVAESVRTLSPRIATTERALRDRPAGAVYIDFVQNSIGKSVASPFSLRARPQAPLSMPLAWQELESGTMDAQSFMIDVSSRELEARGRVWRAAMRRRARID